MLKPTNQNKTSNSSIHSILIFRLVNFAFFNVIFLAVSRHIQTSFLKVSMEFTIRVATPADVSKIAQLERLHANDELQQSTGSLQGQTFSESQLLQ